VKVPFIRYELALAVVEEDLSSKAKSQTLTENLLTPEGLGVQDETFQSLQVSSVHTHI
jgi:hypothetical protein